MRLGKLRLETILLSALSAGLLALLVLIWHRGQNRVHEPERLAARSLAPLDLSVLTATPQSNIDVATIRDNAVFHTQRTFYQPPPASQAIAAPEYDFAGSMSLPQGTRVAYVKKKSDRSSRTVHVGDDLDGWRVEVIDVSRVVIMRDSQRLEIKSTTVALNSGLVHGAVAPHAPQSGIHVLGGQGPVPLPSPAQVSVARTFVPPPPPH
jgi:hypothetical protein